MPANVARIIFAGGGTGGHLFPAIAIADRIVELLQNKMKADILFVGTKRGVEYRMRHSLGYPLHLINVRGIGRSFTLKNLLVPFLLVGALMKSLFLLKKFSPDVVIGTGGYVSWSILRIASLKRIPTVLQEQNSFPGITTCRLAQHAKRIYLGFEEAREHLNTNAKVMVTGNPVRRSILNGDRFEAIKYFNLSPEKTTILVLGGSQGAHAINEAVRRSLEQNSLPDSYQLLWQTGKRDYKDVAAFAGRKASSCTLFPFAERMDMVYAAADLAIARAGAVTLAELAACGVPSILIPYPHAAGDHQRKNARVLVENGMARVIEQKDLDKVNLLAAAVSFHQSDDYAEMKQSLRRNIINSSPAADVIAKDIINLIYETKKMGR
ncbi:MAG: undecaprenyldiphospho-muramoylpentapeptide beta-N-acetylglucosaminyltransferase [Candidatus Zixiibacteriota bacterium]